MKGPLALIVWQGNLADPMSVKQADLDELDKKNADKLALSATSIAAQLYINQSKLYKIKTNLWHIQ